MDSILYAALLLACPLAMGLMMWFMARGMGNRPKVDHRRAGISVEQLREEHRRLGAEIERLDTDPVGGRGGRS